MNNKRYFTCIDSLDEQQPLDAREMHSAIWLISLSIPLNRDLLVFDSPFFFLSPGQNHFKRSAKFSVRSFSLDERQGKQIYSVLKRLIIFIFIVSARAQCKVVYIRHLCLISFVDKTIYTNRVTAETHQNTCKRFSICSWQLIIISWHSNPIQSVNQKYKWMKEIYNIWALFTIFRSNRKCCIFIYNECSCLDWFGSVR